MAKPFGGSGPPAALFHYSRDRGGTHPRGHPAGWSGILQADAYAGFNGLYAKGRAPAPLTEASCWAHGGARFFELADLAKAMRAPMAIEAVRRIDGNRRRAQRGTRRTEAFVEARRREPRQMSEVFLEAGPRTDVHGRPSVRAGQDRGIVEAAGRSCDVWSMGPARGRVEERRGHHAWAPEIPGWEGAGITLRHCFPALTRLIVRIRR